MKAIVSLTAALAALAVPRRQIPLTGTPAGQWVPGLAYIHVKSTSSDIDGPFVPAGLELKVRDATTLFLSLDKKINDHFDAELVGGWPPQHDVDGKGPDVVGSVPYNGTVLSKARENAPTVLVNYSFLDAQSPWRPYVGLGINYTHFYDVDSTYAGNQVNGGPTSLSLKDSWGIAGQVGVRYQLQGHWSLNGSILKADVKSNLTTDTYGFDRTSHLDFNPTVFVVAANYAF